MRSAWHSAALVVAGCLVAGLALSWALFELLLRPPASHVVAALEYFLASGCISLVAGVCCLLVVARYVPALGLKIAIVSLFGSAAALINVIMTPWLMFTERSDFYILIITLLYFLAIALAFAYVVGMYVTRQIGVLREGATQLAAGNFEARVTVSGADEVAELGRAFNRMAEELGMSFGRQRQLEESRRHLIAAVSHDLRTPLAAVRATVEAISDGVITDPVEVHKYLRVIQRECGSLESLIEDLFELSRLETGTLELRLSDVPLGELVVETLDGLQQRAGEKGVHLEVVPCGQVPVLRVDGPRMQRVLINLVDNAIRHTPPGGRVHVEVGRRDGQVRLTVADSGEGVAPEDRQRIFDQFYRGEKSRNRDAGGAGLGLAIARGIVEAHRGTIQVEENEPVGTRFVVTLP